MGFVKDGNFFLTTQEYKDYKKNEKTQRKNKWNSLTMGEKWSRTGNTIGQGLALIFSMYASFKIPDAIFSFYGWDFFFARIISFVFLMISAFYVGSSFSAHQYNAKQQEIKELNFELDELCKSIEQAIWDKDIKPLMKHCDEAYFWEVLENSPHWERYKEANKQRPKGDTP